MPSNPNKPYELRNISRIDKKHPRWNTENHSWQVRFLRNGKPISSWFEDSKFGSKEKSLEAAKLYRDATEKELGGRIHGGPQTHLDITKENLVGVRRRVRKVHYKSGTVDFPVWTALWPMPFGEKGRKAFSVSTYGEEGALQRAIDARNAGAQKFAEFQKSQKVHVCFKPPINLNTRIWRYMDFTKFVSMLQHKGLFFTRIDKLEDAFEGSFSKANKLLRPLIDKHRQFDTSKCSEMLKELRKWVFVSCWHLNEQESAAMWNLYAKSNEAICVQSTYQRLRSTCSKDTPIGTVQYVNYEKEWIEENNPLLPFLYKRKSFAHENELRAIQNLSGVDSYTDLMPTRSPLEDGVWHNMDIGELIETVYIAPQVGKWFFDLVSEEVRVYGYSFPVKKSLLEEEPFY
jgi:hypothetical protein